MKIALGADHAGFDYKNRVAQMLKDQGHEILDFGTWNSTPVDYPEYGYAVGEAVATGQAQRGIVCCGSSLGIAMAANKVPGVRCAPVFEPYSTQLARHHNDCNVIAISERLTGWEMIEQLVQIFLSTPFEGGRHAERVDKLFEFTQEWKRKTLKYIEDGKVSGAETPKSVLP